MKNGYKKATVLIVIPLSATGFIHWAIPIAIIGVALLVAGIVILIDTAMEEDN